jgi:hypothetical protein
LNGIGSKTANASKDCSKKNKMDAQIEATFDGKKEGVTDKSQPGVPVTTPSVAKSTKMTLRSRGRDRVNNENINKGQTVRTKQTSRRRGAPNQKCSVVHVESDVAISGTKSSSKITDDPICDATMPSTILDEQIPGTKSSSKNADVISRTNSSPKTGGKFFDTKMFTLSYCEDNLIDREHVVISNEAVHPEIRVTDNNDERLAVVGNVKQKRQPDCKFKTSDEVNSPDDSGARESLAGVLTQHKEAPRIRQEITIGHLQTNEVENDSNEEARFLADDIRDCEIQPREARGDVTETEDAAKDVGPDVGEGNDAPESGIRSLGESKVLPVGELISADLATGMGNVIDADSPKGEVSGLATVAVKEVDLDCYVQVDSNWVESVEEHVVDETFPASVPLMANCENSEEPELKSERHVSDVQPQREEEAPPKCAKDIGANELTPTVSMAQADYRPKQTRGDVSPKTTPVTDVHSIETIETGGVSERRSSRLKDKLQKPDSKDFIYFPVRKTLAKKPTSPETSQPIYHCIILDDKEAEPPGSEVRPEDNIETLKSETSSAGPAEGKHEDQETQAKDTAVLTQEAAHLMRQQSEKNETQGEKQPTDTRRAPTDFADGSASKEEGDGGSVGRPAIKLIIKKASVVKKGPEGTAAVSSPLRRSSR